MRYLVIAKNHSVLLLLRLSPNFLGALLVALAIDKAHGTKFGANNAALLSED